MSFSKIKSFKSNPLLIQLNLIKKYFSATCRLIQWRNLREIKRRMMVKEDRVRYNPCIPQTAQEAKMVKNYHKLEGLWRPKKISSGMEL